IDIHSISALSIESVQLAKGEKKPVRIEIEMSESAGIFQIGELLQNRIQNSGLKDFIEVYAKVKARERTILQEVHI
ncbi:MAG: HD domain-containing protein, partial [Euryarchaeota archaeon]|nr:HD domain-containing protein [Euryarchaeota archaeon]